MTLTFDPERENWFEFIAHHLPKGTEKTAEQKLWKSDIDWTDGKTN